MAPGAVSAFHTTQWSLVFAARSDGEAAKFALAELCRRYRDPVLAYLRCHGHAPNDADDLTQAFFLHLIERRSKVGADPNRGRFRSYLLGALKHFLSSADTASRALKRGGSAHHSDIDDADAQHLADTRHDPEQEFDRSFAFATIDRSLQRLRAEAVTQGKADQLALLEEFLLEPRESGALQALGQRIGVRPNTLAVALKRWRDRLAALVREEVAQTVAEPGQVEAEVRALRDALGHER